MKPVINMDELTEFHSHERGKFQSSYALIGEKIGAKKLGYSLTVVPPGKMVCPFHNHWINEEMFFILEGEGKLRFGDSEYPVRKNDFIACPPGGREVAHQIVNTGSEDLKYISLSTMEQKEIVEYPDSNKVMSMVGDFENLDFKHISKMDNKTDYFEGEE